LGFVVELVTFNHRRSTYIIIELKASFNDMRAMFLDTNCQLKLFASSTMQQTL